MTNSEIEKEFALPESFRVTPERLELWDKEQEALAQKFALPFASMSPSEVARARAQIIVSEGGFSREVLAESYALLGRYDKAIEIEHDENRRAEYAAIWNAVWREDEEWCPCEHFKGAVPTSKQFVREMIWSLKHNKEMPLLRCVGCGTMNVAEMPQHLQAQRAARSKALSLTEGLNRQHAQRTLLAEGHTTEKLLAVK